MTTHRSRRSRWVIVEWVTLALVIAFLTFCGWWRLSGGTWREVETPSMGQVAPVGSLLWVEPVQVSNLKVGDFITFHPPGHPSETYSHRIYRIDPQGIVTKGVIPAPDPWHLGPGDVVGRVATVWPGVGWIVRAAPVLLIGLVITSLVVRFSGRNWRLPAAVLLGSLTITVAITWYRPFVNAAQLSFAPTADGARASYVSTGLLPIRLSASDPSQARLPGGSTVMRDGQVGEVVVHSADDRGRFAVKLSPAVPAWWWIVLVGICFTPALWSLVIGLSPLASGGDGQSRIQD
jgi:signal peptidase I